MNFALQYAYSMYYIFDDILFDDIFFLVDSEVGRIRGVYSEVSTKVHAAFSIVVARHKY